MRWVRVVAVVVLVIIAGAVVRNQVKVYRNRQARDVVDRAAQAAAKQRQALFDLLKPVGLANCQLARFGEPNDGGYLMCANLLSAVQSGYSYGISGYDQWGCDVATRTGVTVHQYDCFDTRQPSCPTGKTVFHAECVGDTRATIDGRLFDTIVNQFTKNGDAAKRIVMKIDVETAEWDSFAAAPDAVFDQIDQLVVEFHWRHDGTGRWIQDQRYQQVVERLKRLFEVAHVHFNNFSCVQGLEPFPTWAYEVLFVSKRLAVVDAARTPAMGVHPLDAPNNPSLPDCLPPR
jgi:hypothetical protein